MLQTILRERTSAVFRVSKLVDHAGVAVTAAGLTTLTATVFNDQGVAVVVDRNVLNTNGGTFVSPGVFDLELQPADLVATGSYQVGALRLSATFAGGIAGRSWHHVERFVLEDVPGL